MGKETSVSPKPTLTILQPTNSSKCRTGQHTRAQRRRRCNACFERACVMVDGGKVQQMRDEVCVDQKIILIFGFL